MSMESFKRGFEDGQSGQDVNLPTDQRVTNFWQDRVLDFVVPGLGLLMSAAEAVAPTAPDPAKEEKDYIEGYKYGVISRR